ncbi:sulfite oxidase [Bacillus sp. 3255]|uniref:sulfite oxidase n=1 Tax=Bacillus sp. 3255 TaxID=2817904 RepID=UPI002861C558|nr:sulfite oxidase [Bacillus sp. 3255]MDR6879830.1 DMSO/TMAO reductase YedYZ molybdopterin-dependent catalytic subunit [Bacillus sp. 3255]
MMVVLYTPYPITRKLIPEVQEFPMLALSDQVTPQQLFFIHNHFKYPSQVNIRAWQLHIGGCVDRPYSLRYEDLLRMPQVTMPVTLECAGDQRSFFQPKTRGEQWTLGGISHAYWSGVRLSEVLRAARIRSQGVEVTFAGMDRGFRTDRPGEFAYVRSLPLETAMNPDILIALYMNGQPLPFKHGYPARMIVPGWYGMASVKWLNRIEVIDHRFDGPFQVSDYVYDRGDDRPREPVTKIRPHAVIARPADQEVLPQGEHWIAGMAISGDGPVVRVEVSVDNGLTWIPASWLDPPERYAWRRWAYRWNVTESGSYDVKARVWDDAGNSQPVQADWNVKGYGYHAIQHIKVYVDFSRP